MEAGQGRYELEAEGRFHEVEGEDSVPEMPTARLDRILPYPDMVHQLEAGEIRHELEEKAARAEMPTQRCKHRRSS